MYKPVATYMQRTDLQTEQWNELLPAYFNLVDNGLKSEGEAGRVVVNAGLSFIAGITAYQMARQNPWVGIFIGSAFYLVLSKW